MSIAPLVSGGHVMSGAHTTWRDARLLAHVEGERVRDRVELDILPLAAADGRTLAHDLFAVADLPSVSSSAMDGWAVCGEGPWRLGEPIRAGDAVSGQRLEPGHARAIATGAPVPPGTTGVLRSEHGDARFAAGQTLLHTRPERAVEPGKDIRRAGEEAERGERIIAAGTVLSAPTIALAAVAGLDEVPVRARPAMDLVLLGDELRSSGVPGDGGIRDAFLPALPSAMLGAGAVHAGTWFGRDSLDATVRALRETTAPIVVSTGGTARGPADFVRAALDAIGAQIVCDGVAVRPGHPVIMARLPGDRLLLGLPGNPLAAMLVFASLAVPMVAGMTGRTLARPRRERLAVAVSNPSSSTRLVPCILEEDGAVPTAWQGSAMLRGLASADVVLVIPSGGAEAGSTVETLPLPW